MKKSFERLTSALEFKVYLGEAQFRENYGEVISDFEQIAASVKVKADQYRGLIKPQNRKSPKPPEERLNSLIEKLLYELAAKNRPDLTKAAIYIQTRIRQPNTTVDYGQTDIDFGP